MRDSPENSPAIFICGGEPRLMSYCWRISFKVLEVPFLASGSHAFLPSRTACGMHQFRYLAAPGKFESKRFCSDKKVILRWYVTFTRIFVVLYMKEPSHANSQTALSR